jgi:hypothetical protein
MTIRRDKIITLYASFGRLNALNLLAPGPIWASIAAIRVVIAAANPAPTEWR